MSFLVVGPWGISTLSKEGMGLLMGVVPFFNRYSVTQK